MRGLECWRIIGAIASHGHEVTGALQRLHNLKFLSRLDVGKTPATGYRGLVHFTSTDVTATLPADYAFLAADNGVHVFTVTLRAAGNHIVGVRATISPITIGYGPVAVTAS